MFDVPNLDGLSINPKDLREAATVFGLLQRYAYHKARAMEERLAGFVDIARCHEIECETAYRKLPEWAQW